MGRLKVSEPRGVEITTVDQDSPAGKAGLHEQDVILSFNGQQVSNSKDLRRFIRQTPSGQTVRLGISRDGQMQTVPVQLASRKEAFNYNYDYNFHFNPPSIPHIEIPEPPVINVMQRRSGLTVESLSGQLAQYFGTKSGRGVLVRAVDRGSNAEAAGFKAGDVIIAAGNSSVDNVSDWSRVLRQQTGKLSVKILRDRREQTLSFNVPERSRSDASGSFTMPDMSEINKQLAALRPEIERETARAQEEVKREMELHRKDMEEMNSERVKAEMERLRPEIERDIARAQKEAERAMQLNQKDLQKQMEEMRKQLEKSLQDLKEHDDQ
jgi:membrane-associated protease RseP (regulator of RpoE activity)